RKGPVAIRLGLLESVTQLNSHALRLFRRYFLLWFIPYLPNNSSHLGLSPQGINLAKRNREF
ncbi:hypothetical protein FXE74_17975, partial [Vibrio cholerae]